MKIDAKIGRFELGIRLDRKVLIIVFLIPTRRYYNIIDFSYRKGDKPQLDIDLMCELWYEG